MLLMEGGEVRTRQRWCSYKCMLNTQACWCEQMIRISKRGVSSHLHTVARLPDPSSSSFHSFVLLGWSPCSFSFSSLAKSEGHSNTTCFLCRPLGPLSNLSTVVFFLISSSLPLFYSFTGGWLVSSMDCFSRGYDLALSRAHESLYRSIHPWRCSHEHPHTQTSSLLVGCFSSVQWRSSCVHARYVPHAAIMECWL